MVAYQYRNYLLEKLPQPSLESKLKQNNLEILSYLKKQGLMVDKGLVHIAFHQELEYKQTKAEAADKHMQSDAKLQEEMRTFQAW